MGFSSWSKQRWTLFFSLALFKHITECNVICYSHILNQRFITSWGVPQTFSLYSDMCVVWKKRLNLLVHRDHRIIYLFLIIFERLSCMALPPKLTVNDCLLTVEKKKKNESMQGRCSDPVRRNFTNFDHYAWTGSNKIYCTRMWKKKEEPADSSVGKYPRHPTILFNSPEKSTWVQHRFGNNNALSPIIRMKKKKNSIYSWVSEVLVKNPRYFHQTRPTLRGATAVQHQPPRYSSSLPLLINWNLIDDSRAGLAANDPITKIGWTSLRRSGELS
jgi:hypothetical protein